MKKNYIFPTTKIVLATLTKMILIFHHVNSVSKLLHNKNCVQILCSTHFFEVKHRKFIN